MASRRGPRIPRRTALAAIAAVAIVGAALLLLHVTLVGGVVLGVAAVAAWGLSLAGALEGVPPDARLADPSVTPVEAARLENWDGLFGGGGGGDSGSGGSSA